MCFAGKVHIRYKSANSYPYRLISRPLNNGKVNPISYYNCLFSVFVSQWSSVCSFGGAESWVILSPVEQQIKAKIEAVGTPLKDCLYNLKQEMMRGTGDTRKELINNNI
jgi:hypothetical protein